MVLLKRELALAFNEQDWAGTNRAVTRIFLDHGLFVSNVMVVLTIACRNSDCVRLLTGKEIPFRCRNIRSLRLQGKTRRGVTSDAAFVLVRRPTGRTHPLLFGGRPQSFWCNAARSPIPLSAEAFGLRSDMGARLASQRFGFSRFRVLTIAASSARVQSLMETCLQLKCRRGLFLLIRAPHAETRRSHPRRSVLETQRCSA